MVFSRFLKASRVALARPVAGPSAANALTRSSCFLIRSLPASICLSEDLRVQTKLPHCRWPRELLVGRKILLVEDQDGFRSLLTAFLSRYGALVTECASISVAFDSVTRARPDLVITDIGLSDGDGFQLLRVIKKLDQPQ
jgi:hypothetical protein